MSDLGKDNDTSISKRMLLVIEAAEIYREASQQSHTGHWDPTRQNGLGCPECIRARELRERADKIIEQAAKTG